MAISAATPIGSPPSRHAAPKTTAASPIIEPDREVDAAGNHHRRERQRQQSEFDAETHHFEEIGRREKARGERGERGDLERERQQQDPFAVGEGARLPGPTLAERQALPAYFSARPRSASMATAARMMAPWSARSQ